jgi:hypothetical protein
MDSSAVQTWDWPSLGLQLRGVQALDGPLVPGLQRRLSARVPALRRWGRFDRPVHLHLAPSQAALLAAAPRPSQLDLGGFATPDTLWLLAPTAWPEGLDEASLAVVVLHELAHVLWFQRSTPESANPWSVPTWFREGFAVVASEGVPKPPERRLLSVHDLIGLATADDARLAAGSAEAYRVAAHLFWAWHERYGLRGWTALCRQMRGGHPFGLAFERVCGVTEALFLRRTAAELHGQAAQR